MAKKHRIQMSDDMRALGATVAVVHASRKARICTAEGRSDNASRWYPSDRENSDYFTIDIRSPSAAWPWSYLKASSSRKHVVGLALMNPTYIAECAAEAVAKNVVVTEKAAASAARAILKVCRSDADADDLEEARLARVAEAEEKAKAIAAAIATKAEIDAADAAFDAAIAEDWNRLDDVAS